MFNVKGQRLSNAAKNYFVSGSKGYLEAHFNFSSDWDGFNKVASFYDENNEEYPVILNENKCKIPNAVLQNEMFKVKVTGKKGDVIIPSTRVMVRQVG